MKFTYLVAFLLVILLAAYPFLKPSEQPDALTGLPWQIDVMPDGSTQVFGLIVGKTRLSEAPRILNSDMEFAIIAAADEVGKLEMYFSKYRVGLLSGKLILQTSVTGEQLMLWREHAIKSDYVATGRAKKYYLSEEHLQQALDEIITAIVFIPSVNLDDEIILSRFGQPDKRIEGEGFTRYLYPGKGLEISLVDDGKEVLLYTVPDKMH